MSAGAPLNSVSLPPAPGKACGTCGLCCKIPAIAETDSPAHRWCRHFAAGRGCTIYDTRPVPCRHYVCMWLFDASLGPEWKPDRARFMLTLAADGKTITVEVDAAQPTAFMREPYLRALHGWAARLMPDGGLVCVRNGAATKVVMPDRIVDLGFMAVGQAISVDAVSDRFGTRYEARLVDGAA